MKHLYSYLGLFLVFSLSPLAAQAKGANFTAHEWGTFTSLVGSDGITQNGMYHEDEPLPSFVHGFGELVGQPASPPPPHRPGCNPRGKIPCDFILNNSVTQKMETPVIYFYSKDAISVTVDVKFPEGAISETYPGPIFTTPTSNSAPVLANGHTIFNVNVMPLGMALPVPYVEPGNIYAHARKVDSSYVQINRESEKFIFYRGAGRFQPEMPISSKDGGLTIGANPTSGGNFNMFLVDVSSDGHAQGIKLVNLFGKSFVSARDIDNLRDHARATNVMEQSAIHTALAQSLITSGLTYDEAEAMINTWENGYLRVPGLRLLYILPSHEVEKILPLTMTPAPDELRRVFVGRIEVMLDTDEQELIDQVAAAGDLIDVTRLGRFAESKLRRAFQVYSEHGHSPVIESRFQRLIARAATAGLQ